MTPEKLAAATILANTNKEAVRQLESVKLKVLNGEVYRITLNGSCIDLDTTLFSEEFASMLTVEIKSALQSRIDETNEQFKNL